MLGSVVLPALPGVAGIRLRHFGFANGLRGPRPDGPGRSHRPGLDDGQHRLRSARRAACRGASRHRTGRLARWHRRLVPGLVRLPAPDRWPIRLANPEVSSTTPYGFDPSGSITRSPSASVRSPCPPSSTGCSPTPTTTCWPRLPTRVGPGDPWAAPVTVPAVWTRTWGARVIATGPQARTSFPVEVDTHVTGLLVHAGGALTTSFETVKPGQPWLEVHGSEGSLAAPDPNGFDSPVLISGKGAQWQPVPDQAGYRGGNAAAVRGGRQLGRGRAAVFGATPGSAHRCHRVPRSSALIAGRPR